MYSGRSIPDIICSMVSDKLDAPMNGLCEDHEHGRICASHYSSFSIDIKGIPNPFTVTRDETQFIVYHRGLKTVGSCLGAALEESVKYWQCLTPEKV